MARLIDDRIKKPLAEQMLFGALESGGTLDIVLEEGELRLLYTGKDEAQAASSGKESPILSD